MPGSPGRCSSPACLIGDHPAADADRDDQTPDRALGNTEYAIEGEASIEGVGGVASEAAGEIEVAGEGTGKVEMALKVAGEVEVTLKGVGGVELAAEAEIAWDVVGDDKGLPSTAEHGKPHAAPPLGLRPRRSPGSSPEIGVRAVARAWRACSAPSGLSR